MYKYILFILLKIFSNRQRIDLIYEFKTNELKNNSKLFEIFDLQFASIKNNTNNEILTRIENSNQAVCTRIIFTDGGVKIVKDENKWKN